MENRQSHSDPGYTSNRPISNPAPFFGKGGGVLQYNGAMAHELAHFVAISTTVSALGSLKLWELYQQKRSATKVWASLVKMQPRPPDPSAILTQCQKLGLSIVTIQDEQYPELLRQITDPPLSLYYKGWLPKDEPTVAIVGTRKPTDYGKQSAAFMSKGLASAGVVVVSGLAYGIDSVAHQATLEVGGLTLAVSPGGLDATYPRQHERLAQAILKRGGGLISEYPPGVPPAKHHFGVRNRIIAGLALGTIIIEAAEHSGTLLTAKSTLEYNRELFAVPHPIFSPMGIGPNRLIQLGAKLVTHSTDVLQELNINPVAVGQVEDLKPFEAGSPEQVVLVELIGSKPRHVDELVKQSGIAVATVTATLTLLEINGLVRNLGGGFYVRSK